MPTRRGSVWKNEAGGWRCLTLREGSARVPPCTTRIENESTWGGSLIKKESTVKSGKEEGFSAIPLELLARMKST